MIWQNLEIEFFKAIDVLKSLKFIDSEEYIYQAQKSGQTISSRRRSRIVIRYRFWNLSFCNIK